jgi:SAM-dependent methyltransferase
MIDITRAQAIEGWMTNDELEWLATISQRSQNAVEVGCWKGRSTRAIGDHIQLYAYAVDQWNGSLTTSPSGVGSDSATFFLNVGDLIDRGKVLPVMMHSYSFAQAAYIASLQTDFVFLDDDHGYNYLMREIELYRHMVRPGGILAGHDFGNVEHPGVERAVRETFGDRFSRAGYSIWWVQL